MVAAALDTMLQPHGADGPMMMIQIPLYYLLMLIYPINYLAELTSEIFQHEIRDEQPQKK